MKLHLVHRWNDEHMADVVTARTVTIGETPRCTLVVPTGGRGSRAPLFTRTLTGRWSLALSRGMRGMVELGGEQRAIEDILAAETLANPRRKFHKLELGSGDRGVVTLDQDGEHAVSFEFGPSAPKLARPVRDERQYHKTFAAVAAAHALLVLVTWFFRDANDVARIEMRRALLKEPSQAPSFLTPQPEVKPPGEKAAAAAQAGTRDGERRSKPGSTAGAEGRAGGSGERPRSRAPMASSLDAIRRSVQTKGVLKHSDSLRALADKGALASLDGALMQGSTGYGRGKGTGVGDGVGTGTLTRSSGDGPGGGGKVLADIVTKGKMDTGTARGPRGLPTGKGVAETSVSVSAGTADGDFGGLTREQVSKVVKEHYAALRYCFEKELQRTPDMGGQMVVSWRIEPSGAVGKVKVGKSQLGNVRVDDCVARQVKNWRFPQAANGGSTEVNYPFVFEGK